MLTSQAPFFRYRFVFLVAAVFLVGFFILPQAADAATRYWVNDSGDGLWSNTNNWSASSAGAGGAGVPGNDDTVVFDGGTGGNHDGNVNMGSANITLTTLDFQAGYDGNITLTSLTLKVATTLNFLGPGSVTHNSGTVIVGENSVGPTGDPDSTYNSASPVTFNNFKINKDSNYSLAIADGDTIAVTGTFTQDQGRVKGTAGGGTETLILGGNFVSTSSGNFTMDAGDIVIEFGGTGTQTYDDSGRVSAGTNDFGTTVNITKTGGTLTLTTGFSNGGTTTVSGVGGTFALSDGSAHTFADLVITAGTVTQGTSTITFTGGANALQVNGGTFTGGSGAMSFNDGSHLEVDSGTFTATSGTTTMRGDLNVNSSATFNHNNGEFYWTTDDHDDDIDIEGASGTITLYSLRAEKGGGGYTLSIDSTADGIDTTVVVEGTLTRNSDTRFNESSGATYPLQLKGNLDFNGTTTWTGVPLYITGTATQTLDFATIDIWDTNVTVDKSGGSVRLLTGLTLNAGGNNTLTIDEGIFDIDGQVLTVGTLTVNSGGTFRFNGDETPTAPTLNPGSTLSYAGTAGPYNVADLDYTQITLAIDGAATFNMTSGETINIVTIVSGATLNLNTNNFTVTTTFSNEGTLVLDGNETTVSFTNDTNSGLVKYDGAVTVTGLKAGNSYYDLEFANAGGSWTAGAAVDVNGALAISTGTFNTGGFDLNVFGNITGGGTFTQTSGTTTLDGTNQTLNAGTAGTLTFYNLVKNVTTAYQLTLDDDDTFTVTNNLTWTGQAGQLLTVRSDVDSTPADMSVGGTKTVSYLSVRDLNNTGSSIACMTGCTNGTGNTGWLFASSATPSSITYQDNDSNGTIDRVIIDFGAAVTITGTIASTRLTLVNPSENSFGGSLSGNASVESGDVVITISSADANETGHITQPTLAYSDDGDNTTNYFADTGGDIIQTFAATNVSDGAKPRAKTATFYDAASSDGKLDLITVVFTENISAAANGSADWALSSAANFASIVEGTVECNSGAAGANECDYNFTTSTVKTNVGDLSLAYTAGTSVTDGTNTANSLTVTSASSPAFTDGAAPEAIDAQISIAGGTGTSGAYKVDDTITVTWNAANSSDISSVTANLSGWGGSATATMTDTTACGGTASNNIYEACYTILGSEGIDTTNVNVSVNATDTATNNRSNADTTNATVDTVVPTVTAAKISVTGAGGTGGAFKNGDTAVGRWDNSGTGDNNTDTITSVTINASAFDDGSSSLSGLVASGIYTATIGTLDSQDDTNNNVTVTVVDNAGNSTATAGTNNYTIDTILPTLTNTNITVTGCTGTSGACKNGDTAVGRWDNSATGDNNTDTIASVTINASAFDDGSSSLSGLVASGIYTATIGTLDPQDDTGNTITATVVDNAGNSTGPTTSSASYTIDTIVPVVTAGSLSVTGSSGTSGAFKFGDLQTYIWNPTTSGEGDTITTVSFNGSSFNAADTAAGGALVTNWTATSTLGASQDDTLNTITATVVDNAGNSTTSDASTASYTIDTVVPVVTTANISVTGANGTSGAFKLGDSPFLRWDVTTEGETDTLASVIFDGSSFDDGSGSRTGIVTVDGVTVYAATLAAAMDDQDDTNNNITVTVVDNAGNSTATVGTNNYVIDTIVPVVTQASVTVAGATGTSGAFRNGDAQIYTWNPTTSGETDTIASVTFVGISFKSTDTSVAGSSGATWTATSSLDGSQDDTGNTVTATVVDNAGNSTGPTTSSSTYIVDTILPTLSTSVYQDADANGRVDRVVLTFSEDVSNGFAADKDEWTFPTAGTVSLAAPSLDASVTVSTTTVTIVPANSAINTTGGATNPTVSYTDIAGTLQDDAGNAVANFTAQSVSDDAAPAILSATFYDIASSDGKLDLITVVFTENVAVVANASADWAVSSPTLGFGGLVEGTVLCNSGSAGANECDYNFTTSTVKTDVGDLALAYTAGTSLQDGSGNQTGNLSITSATGPAFTDGAAPEAVSSQISVAGGTGTGAAYKVGDTVTATWNAGNTSDVSAVTADLSGWGGGAAVAMTDTTACGGTASNKIWEACYIIVGDEGIDATSVNVTVNATDTSTNNRSGSSTANATVDTIVPVVTQASVTVAGATGTSGAFRNGDAQVYTWNPTTSGETDTIASVTFVGISFKSTDTSVAGSSGATWTATSSLDGSQDDTGNTVTATVVDNAGNSTGPTTSSSTYIVDTILPTLSTSVYQDADANGRVDRVVLTFSEDVSNGFAADKDEWTFPTAGTVSLAAPSLDASVTVSTTTVTVVPANSAINTTGGATNPTVSYTDIAGTLQDDAGNAVANFTAQSVSDDAAPQIQSTESRYTMDNNDDGTVDFIRLHFTESVADASVAAADFKIYISVDAAGSLVEAYASGVPTAGGNRTDAVNDELIFVGITSGTETILANKTDYALYVQMIGSIEDASSNASSAEGAAVQSLDSAQPRIVSSQTDDADVNGQIDTIQITFTEDLAGATVAADDFAAAGYTVSGASESAGVVTLTLTESGSSDTDATPGITMSLGVIQDASTLSLASDALSATPTDSAGPALVGSSVASGAVLIPAVGTWTLTFSEPIATGSFALSPAPALLFGAFVYAWDGTNETVTVSTNGYNIGQTIVHTITAPDASASANAYADSTYTLVPLMPSSSAGGGGGGGGGATTVGESQLNPDGTRNALNPLLVESRVELLSPNAGEVLSGGSPAALRWSLSDDIADVVVYYSIDGGVSYGLVKAGISKTTTSFSWQVPNLSTELALVKIVGRDSGGGALAADVSDGFFTITADTSIPLADAPEATSIAAASGMLTRESAEALLPVVVDVDHLVKVADDGDPTTDYDSTVYYIGLDAKRHPFVNAQVYFTWYENFDGVRTIDTSTLTAIPLGAPVLTRPGTMMVKIQSDVRTFAVEPGDYTIRWVPSETVAVALYGSAWNKRVMDIEPTYFTRFTMGPDLSHSLHPSASVIEDEEGARWYFDGTARRAFASGEAFAAGKFQEIYVIKTPASLGWKETAQGSAIVGFEDELFSLQR